MNSNIMDNNDFFYVSWWNSEYLQLHIEAQIL